MSATPLAVVRLIADLCDEYQSLREIGALHEQAFGMAPYTLAERERWHQNQLEVEAFHRGRAFRARYTPSPLFRTAARASRD